MPIVCNPQTGDVKVVKNLGWLIKHWKDVQEFDVRQYTGEWFQEHILDAPDGILIARLLDGRVYACHWWSIMICKDWLHRPVFSGAPLYWIDHWTEC